MAQASIVSKKVHVGDNMFSEVNVEYANGRIVALQYEYYQRSYARKDVEAYLHIYSDKVVVSDGYQTFISKRSPRQLELMVRTFRPFIHRLPQHILSIIEQYNRKEIL